MNQELEDLAIILYFDKPKIGGLHIDSIIIPKSINWIKGECLLSLTDIDAKIITTIHEVTEYNCITFEVWYSEKGKENWNQLQRLDNIEASEIVGAIVNFITPNNCTLTFDGIFWVDNGKEDLTTCILHAVTNWYFKQVGNISKMSVLDNGRLFEYVSNRNIKGLNIREYIQETYK